MEAEQHAREQKTSWARQHPWLLAVIAFVLGAGFGYGAEAESPGSGEGQAAVESASGQPQEGEEPPVLPEPSADYSQTCDYLLPDDINSSNYRFIGTSVVRNTGNIGAVVRVVFQWGQAGGQPVRVVRKVRVPYGGERTVNVDVPATGENIERLQSLPFDQQCKVQAAVVGTFGEAR